MGTSLSRNESINTKLYTWSGSEFRKEYALIYTSSGRVFPTRSCTSFYRVNPDKVLFTIDDCLCLGNCVRVNVGFVAVRDSNGRFKIGSVEFKDSGQRFEKQHRRASKSQVLLLQCADGYDYRYDQLGVYRKNRKEYLVKFYTGISPQGGPSHSHNVRIYCDPEKGFDVELSGPYRHPSAKEEEKDLCDTDYISCMPPDNVLKIADDIRKELKIEEDTEDGASARHPQIVVNNNGPIQAPYGGAVIQGNVNNGPNYAPYVGATIHGDVINRIRRARSSGRPPQTNTLMNTGRVQGSLNGSTINSNVINVRDDGI